MTHPDDMSRDRLHDLLTLEATEGLPDAERQELSDLARGVPGADVPDLEAAAAAFDLGFEALELEAVEPPPADLAARVALQAKGFFAGREPTAAEAAPAPASSPSPEAERRVPWAFWTALAAGWAAAVVLLGVVLADTGRTRGPAPDRAALLQQKGVTIARFAPAGAPGYDAVQGDAVWSRSDQRGYLRFRGLAANDPKKAQYQLWIVDPKRDAEPVDGGVFDIPAGDGEVVVAIDPKLEVGDPKAFVVTLEQPGGVVVSEGPHLLIAAVD